MVAILVINRIDLNWAEDQYWYMLLDCIGEIGHTLDPSNGKESRRPLKASEVKSYLVE